MVVDDDADIVDLTRLVLEGGGYRVLVARSGPEALDALQKSLPSLILLDINMPEMDGWQLLKILKVDERTVDIPVAMFSIKNEMRDKIRGLQNGAYDYIPKPFSCEELLGRVQRIFESLSQSQVDR
jgi:DNA-binding response OmpR family regulator